MPRQTVALESWADIEQAVAARDLLSRIAGEIEGLRGQTQALLDTLDELDATVAQGGRLVALRPLLRNAAADLGLDSLRLQKLRAALQIFQATLG